MRGALSCTSISSISPASPSSPAASEASCSSAEEGWVQVPRAGKSSSVSLGKWLGAFIHVSRVAAAAEGTPVHGRPRVWTEMEVQDGVCDQSYWVHPTVADAAIHAGSALRGKEQTGMMVSVAIGYYGAQTALQGALLA